MTVEISKLANGIRVVTDPMPGIESATVGVWIDCGARSETKALNGVAHMLEHMAFKGTRTRSARRIAEDIEAVGGYLNAYTAREQTCYYARVLKGDVRLALDLIADILANSVFDKDELEREKHVVLQEIGQAHDTPDDIIFDHLQEAAFPAQSVGRPILGSPESVGAIKSATLFKWVARNYRGEAITLIASGAVDHKSLLAMATDKFGAFPPGRGDAAPPARYRGGEFRDGGKLEQAHLAFGVEGIALTDADFFVSQVFSTVLGGGMSSRLFQEVREKRGLCYSVYSFGSSYRDTGFFGIYAGTGARELKEIVPVIMAEFEALAGGATAEEVARGRAQIKAGLLMMLESPTSRAEQIAGQLFAFGRPFTAAEIIEKVDGVDAPAVARFAERMLKRRKPALAAMGPVRNLETYDRLAARFG